MARVTQDVTAGWYGEAGEIAASDAALDSVTFTARKLAALVVVNNELLEDAGNVDAVIEQIIAQAMALKFDYTALCGSGVAPEPHGLNGLTGVNTVASVGAPADFDKFLTAIYEVRKDNFEPNAAIYAARTAETLAKLKTGLSDDKTPLAMPVDWAALTKYVTNQVPVNLGTGEDESLAFIGQWNQLAIGMRRNLTIEVAREGAYNISGTVYSSFQKDQTLIRATLRADVQAFQPAAFTVMSGITV
jgi:HK97 family phage major capsid protein